MGGGEGEEWKVGGGGGRLVEPLFLPARLELNPSGCPVSSGLQPLLNYAMWWPACGGIAHSPRKRPPGAAQANMRGG